MYLDLWRLRAFLVLQNLLHSWQKYPWLSIWLLSIWFLTLCFCFDEYSQSIHCHMLRFPSWTLVIREIIGSSWSRWKYLIVFTIQKLYTSKKRNYSTGILLRLLHWTVCVLVVFPLIMHSESTLTWTTRVTQVAIISFVLDMLGFYMFENIVL